MTTEQEQWTVNRFSDDGRVWVRSTTDPTLEMLIAIASERHPREILTIGDTVTAKRIGEVSRTASESYYQIAR